VLVIPGLGWEFLARPSSELLSWLRIAFAFGLALIAATNVRSVRHARWAFAAVLIGGIQPIVSGFHDLFTGTYTSKDGFNSVRGPFDFPNEFGFYLVIVLVLAVVATFELQRRWVRIVPHVVDSVLLGSAIALTVAIGQYPLTDNWLSAKVAGLFLYIVLGSIALKRGGTRRIRVAAWIAAQAVFFYIVAVAITRRPLPFIG